MEEDEEEDEKVDPDAEGVAKMRASEIKAELDVRGVGYAGIFEKVRTCHAAENPRVQQLMLEFVALSIFTN